MYADELTDGLAKRTIEKIKAAGRKGVRVKIGGESRALTVLVEDGEIFQEISADGRHYIFIHPDFAD
jgi:hypothetical protein